MTLQLNALNSTFKIAPVSKRKEEAEFKRWQAVFYTVRSLLWNASKSQVFKDGLQNQLIEAIAPGKRLEDGSWSRPEYDPEDIKALYSEAWKAFDAQFDEAFIQATREELLEYAQSRFGMSEAAILDMNRQRTAERFSRDSEERFN